MKIFDDELFLHYRQGDKLKTKNGVIITQKNKLMQQIKMHTAESEVGLNKKLNGTYVLNKQIYA